MYSLKEFHSRLPHSLLTIQEAPRFRTRDLSTGMPFSLPSGVTVFSFAFISRVGRLAAGSSLEAAGDGLSLGSSASTTISSSGLPIASGGAVTLTFTSPSGIFRRGAKISL